MSKAALSILTTLIFVFCENFYIFASANLKFYFAMRVELEEKVRNSVLLIRHAYRHAIHHGQHLEVAISGGKDSDVLIELCKIACVWGKDGLRPLYRCTTIDPPGTINHVLSQGVEIRRPKMSFRDCILRSGFPTMFTRHCCGVLKEFSIEDYVVIGVRRSESVKRAKNYHEPEICKVYPNGGGKAIQYLPLLDWTDDDVREFVQEHNIKCHPLYYDEQGNFHVERRLGCMGCPLTYRKKRAEEFKKYPKMVRFWCHAGKEYLDSHPKVKVHEYFDDVFEWFVCNLFYASIKDFRVDYPREDNAPMDLFGDEKKDCKSFLEDYFNVNLDF